MRVLVSTIADCWEVVAVSLDFVLCLFSSFHAFQCCSSVFVQSIQVKRAYFLLMDYIFLVILQSGGNGGGYGAYGGYSSGRNDSSM